MNARIWCGSYKRWMYGIFCLYVPYATQNVIFVQKKKIKLQLHFISLRLLMTWFMDLILFYIIFACYCFMLIYFCIAGDSKIIMMEEKKYFLIQNKSRESNCTTRKGVDGHNKAHILVVLNIFNLWVCVIRSYL